MGLDNRDVRRIMPKPSFMQSSISLFSISYIKCLDIIMTLAALVVTFGDYLRDSAI